MTIFSSLMLQQDTKGTSGSVEDISISSSSHSMSEAGPNGNDGCDLDVRSGHLDKGEDLCKDLTEPLDLSRLPGDPTLDNNIKVDGDVDGTDKEKKVPTELKKPPIEGKKASVSLNLKRSPSPSGATHSPSRPSSRM